MNRFLVSCVAAVAAAAPASSFAQVPPPPGVAQGTAPMVRQAPATPVVRSKVMVMTDHVMTRDDVVKHVREMFSKLDTNHDGVVTREEVDALHTRMMGAMGMAGDMQKRMAEHGVMMGNPGEIFDRLDTNHDGSISRQEFMAHHGQVREERVMILRNGPGGTPDMLHGPDMPGGPGMEQMKVHVRAGGMERGFGGRLFDMADTNHDGRVTLQEAEAAALAHFDKADLNHDGRITPDERSQAHQMMHGEHRPI